MKYKILQLFTLCTILGIGTLYAQKDGDFKRFSVALLFGNGAYLTDPIVPASPGISDWTVSGEAPTASAISALNNVTNIAGAEIRFFPSDKFALKFNGYGSFKNTPAQDNVSGVTPATSDAVDPASPNAGWIPNYAATVMENSLNANLSVGFEYHFTGDTKVSPFVGIMVPFCYGRRSVYDPTVSVDMTKSLNDPTAVNITDVGTRHIEQIGFGGQLVFGADYNLSESFYLGIEIKPVSYLYAYNIKYPAPGLETRSADTHIYGFFTQPILKIGFKF